MCNSDNKEIYERKKLTEDDLDSVFAEAAKLVIAKKKLKGVPIARYEISTGKVYMEYPDGRKVYEKKA